jgi:hypothetical protein
LSAQQPPRGRGGGSVSSVEPWSDYLRQRWQAGCRSPRQLWQELRAQGYSGSEPAVWRWLLRLREAEAAGEPVEDVRPRQALVSQTYALTSKRPGS